MATLTRPLIDPALVDQQFEAMLEPTTLDKMVLEAFWTGDE
ncbi:Uncharacterised protein [Mycolicibacterium aurum]|uniref:Uncharacterized protein n=1 Tax=Mycolicibacterium aurum TaxID=1791 RepID=A0A3S5EIY0_MYCAU|nr:hypothetical protein [Mycolicibacterium aurum]VEG51571.1 Uncharacterised protein [Mycolicibacterium aurum]